MTKKPFVRIIRGNEFFGRLRNLDVYINGRYVGMVTPGCQADFAVTPGLVRVYVKMDWLRSAERSFDMDSDKNGFMPVRVELPKNGVNIKGIPLAIAWALVADSGAFFKLETARSFEFEL